MRDVLFPLQFQILSTVLFVLAGEGKGQAEKISAVVVPGLTGHETYLTHSYSMPIVVDGKDVYITFLEDDLHTSSSVVRLDGETGGWSDPVRLGGGRRFDAHYYPNIVMDRDGYLHAFYGCHGDALRYRRSTLPRKISKWDSETYPLSTATYPRPFVLKTGELIVFMRTQRPSIRYGYIVSRDHGRTWSTFTTLIDGPGSLVTPYVGGVVLRESDTGTTTAHLAWSWYDQKNRPYPYYYEDAMYATHDIDSSEWRKADGTVQSLPITFKNAKPIRRRKKFYVEDMTVDSAGHPILLVSQYGLTESEKRDSRTLTAEFDQTWSVTEPFPGELLPVGSSRIIQADEWTVLVGYMASRGLVVAQRRDRDRNYQIRPIEIPSSLTPLHPVILADEHTGRLHVAATGYKKGQPGRLIYATATIEPLPE